MIRKLPALAIISERFIYNHVTGEFHLRSRPGIAAGTTNADGYILLSVPSEKRQFMAHRIAWLMHYGADTVKEIDHINGNPSDNRISNLRECTRGENCQNRKPHGRANLLGAHWQESRRLWRSVITINGVRHQLGSAFSSAEEAHQAYLRAKRELHKFQPTDPVRYG